MSRLVFILAIGFWLAEARADDRFLVAGQINGKPVTLIFDTGSTCSVLWSNAAVRLGLTNFQGGDIGSAATSEPCTLSIGKSNTRMYFHILELPPWATNSMFDGLLGWKTFKDNIIQLDAASNQLSVLDKLPAGLGKWSKVQMNADLAGLELQFRTGKRSTENLIVDTGDEGGVRLPAAAWQAWRVENPGQPVTLESRYNPFFGPGSLQVSWAKSLAFGNIRLTEVAVSEAQPIVISGPSNYVAVLGMAALKRMDVVLDGPKGVAYCRAKTNHAGYFEHNGLGVAFLPGESTNGPLIAHVLTNSPGWDAGIRNGDELMKSDGEDVTHWYTNSDSGEYPPVGTRKDYTLRRGTNMVEVTAVTRQILNCRPPNAADLTNTSSTHQPVTNFFAGQAVRINSNDADEYDQRGYGYVRAGNFDRAIADFTESIRRDPKDDYAYANRGAAYATAGNLHSAMTDLDESIRLAKTNSEPYYFRASVYFQSREFDKALSDVSEAITRNPTNTKYRMLRVKLYESDRRLALAMPDCTAVLRQEPTNSEAWYGRGLSYYATSNLDKAIGDFEEAVRLGGTNEGLFDYLGLAHSQAGKFDKAADDFTRAISINPTNEPAYFYRGDSYVRLGRAQSAIGDFTRAIQLNPTNPQYYQARAYANEMETNLTDALKDLTEAILLDPKSAWALNARALLYEQQERYADALADFHQGMTLNPSDVVNYFRAARLEATCTNASVRNGAQAVKDATKACELTNWKDVGSVEALAAAYAESGNFPRAIELEKQALSLTDGMGDEVQRPMRDRIALYEKSQPHRTEK